MKKKSKKKPAKICRKKAVKKEHPAVREARRMIRSIADDGGLYSDVFVKMMLRKIIEAKDV